MDEYVTAGDEINGWESMLSSITDDDVDLFCFPVDEMEQMLMVDGADVAIELQPPAELPDDFFSDLLLDSPAGSGQVDDAADDEKNSGSNSNSDSNSPAGSSHSAADRDERENGDDVAVEERKKGGGGEDAMSKKERRQLRNRDAAVRSRERKKMYVKDLEMKSRYLEGECRRLGMLLQCCAAENQALRISLQNAKAFDVSMAKQESAVLFLESLLLGSLLWFLGIMCLFNLPRSLPRPENGGDKVQGSLVLLRKPQNHDELFGSPMSQLFIMGRRCRGSKSKMKTSHISFGIFV